MSPSEPCCNSIATQPTLQSVTFPYLWPALKTLTTGNDARLLDLSHDYDIFRMDSRFGRRKLNSILGHWKRSSHFLGLQRFPIRRKDFILDRGTVNMGF